MVQCSYGGCTISPEGKLRGNRCRIHILLAALEQGKAQRVQKEADGSYSSVCGGSSLDVETIKGKLIRIFVATDTSGKDTVLNVASVARNSNTLEERVFKVGGKRQPEMPLCLMVGALTSHTFRENRWGKVITRHVTDDDRRIFAADLESKLEAQRAKNNESLTNHQRLSSGSALPTRPKIVRPKFILTEDIGSTPCIYKYDPKINCDKSATHGTSGLPCSGCAFNNRNIVGKDVDEETGNLRVSIRLVRPFLSSGASEGDCIEVVLEKLPVKQPWSQIEYNGLHYVLPSILVFNAAPVKPVLPELTSVIADEETYQTKLASFNTRRETVSAIHQKTAQAFREAVNTDQPRAPEELLDYVGGHIKKAINVLHGKGYDCINLAKGELKRSLVDTVLKSTYRLFDENRAELDSNSKGFFRYLVNSRQDDLYKDGKHIRQNKDEGIGFLSRHRGGPLLNAADGSYVSRDDLDELGTVAFYEVNVFMGSEQHVLECEERSHQVAREYIAENKLSMALLNERDGAGKRYGTSSSCFLLTLTAFKTSKMIKSGKWMFNNQRDLVFRKERATMLGMTIKKAEEAGYFGSPACDSYERGLKRKRDRKQKKSAMKKSALADRTNVSDSD
eukprot:scaffold60723_cov38-Cyclotella_meneghiniana.AAC.1